MSLSVAIQMDPVAAIDIRSDSSFALGLEAQKRGHQLWCYTPDMLSFAEGHIQAIGESLTLRDEIGNHFDAGPMEQRPLTDFDVILMRQDRLSTWPISPRHIFLNCCQPRTWW